MSQAPRPIQKPPVEPPKVYEKHGALISKITVESWSGETDFYTRFALDAEKSHLAKPQRPDEELKPAQFYSLVPQYSHMTGAQTEYYRRLREFWRHGKHPDCDSAYVMLYIFELLNLGSVDKGEIARALTSVWLGYRERMPRLDSYMCEWLEDFCMINDLPLPDEIFTHISEIAAKAHFKEYYFDAMLSAENRLILAASALIDCYSDYVFSASKYYGENREKYDKYIPLAVSAVLDKGLKQKRGIFACDQELQGRCGHVHRLCCLVRQEEAREDRIYLIPARHRDEGICDSSREVQRKRTAPLTRDKGKARREIT